MIIELHILQNFAPSNLNRDDTNSPKECDFGGYRRARISSQCIKKAIRDCDIFKTTINGKEGVRTKLLVLKIAEKITGEKGGNTKVNKVVADIFDEAGLTPDKDLKTDILVFIDKLALDQIAQMIKTKLTDLEKGNKETKQTIVNELAKIVEDKVKTPDISLFGRMLAVKPESPLGKRTLNINAACQVAHAISTSKVGVEFDFYTAMDDLKKPEEEAGAGMMGTVEYNSACFYRYANIDCNQLQINLGGDKELARKTIEAFIRAAVNAIPTGKQNSFAAQNPPSFVFAVVRDSGAWSLTNAFVKPVRVGETGDLVEQSIEKLVEYWGKLSKVYGDKGIKAKPAFVLDAQKLAGLDAVDTLEELIAKVNETITAGC